MAKLLALHGPNLNLLGTREPAVYGATTLADVQALCEATGKELGIAVDFRQSNHEGLLIDWIHEAGTAHRAGTLLGVVFNAGAYTHTSLALADCLAWIGIPCVEVHISNIFARTDEPLRQKSIIGKNCIGCIAGFGVTSYALAVVALWRQITENPNYI